MPLAGEDKAASGMRSGMGRASIVAGVSAKSEVHAPSVVWIRHQYAPAGRFSMRATPGPLDDGAPHVAWSAENSTRYARPATSVHVASAIDPSHAGAAVRI